MFNSKNFLFFIAVFIETIFNANGDLFNEELFIKPLPPAHLYTYFQFITLVNDNLSCKCSAHYLATMFLYDGFFINIVLDIYFTKMFSSRAHLFST